MKKAPMCCRLPMNAFGYLTVDAGDDKTLTFFAFQCSMCGHIEEKLSDNLEEATQ